MVVRDPFGRSIKITRFAVQTWRFCKCGHGHPGGHQSDRSKRHGRGTNTPRWISKNITFSKKDPQDFRSVLSTQKPVSMTNLDFKVLDCKMHTYSIEKTGLSYLYIKRKVAPDGVTTSPLALL